MKGLRSIVTFIIEDFKTDIQFLKQVFKGEYKSKYTLKQWLTIDVKSILKESWLWYLIIILAFCCGYYYATQSLQDACNQHIINTFIPQNEQLLGNSFLEKYTFNFSNT